MGAPVAAVDIGTNTVRLLISDGENDLERRTVITGLGRGLDETGRLNPDGRRLALEAFAEFAASARRAGVTRVRAVATSASRDASDAASFVSETTAILGVRPEVIPGSEEAALSYAGATADLDGDSWTVADIGGGSTEIISAKGGISFDVGSVRVTDRFFGSRPVPTEAWATARRWVDSVIGEVPGQTANLVGVAGTWTTLAALEQQLEPYDPSRVHHFVLTRAVVASWRRRLGALSVAETNNLTGLAPGRAPVIYGGVVVAEAVMDTVGAASCLVSEADLLDGIVAGLVAS